MSYHFCTISTHSHLFKTYALADSIEQNGGVLHVLIIDAQKSEIQSAPSNVRFYFLDELKSDTALKLVAKYKNNKDKLRWTLKAVFLNFLLDQFEQVIYVDNDIFFYHDFKFLFDELKSYDILLTPHHYSRNPYNEQNWFEANFKLGLYNAGFIGVNREAINTLIWWAEACLYRCEKNYLRGLFDDQKYLDLFPIIHRNTKILEHRGCNVAEWNREECVPVPTENGILINGKYQLVFYHFNFYSLNTFIYEKHHPLRDYFVAYFEQLKKYKPELEEADLFTKPSLVEKTKYTVWRVLNKINQRTL